MSDLLDAIPGFVGVISEKSNDFEIDATTNLKTVIDDNLIKIFVKEDSLNQVKKYYSSNHTFLWTGGLNLGNQFQLDEFNPHQVDHKFVYISFLDGDLKLYTDHYSKIPLLYIYTEDALYFSSSLELLLKFVSKQRKETNLNGLLFYYNFGFTSFSQTLLKNVSSLSGGQQLTYYNGNIQVKNYFDVYNIDTYNSNDIDSNVQLIDDYLLKSTKKTLEPYKNIGIALSGGVDSGYLAQKISECGKSFNAYTLGFKDDYNEFERVDYLSKRLNFTTRKIIINPDDIISNYLEASKNASFPVGFNNSILNFIYKEASQDGIDIMFDGDGADRLFLGMNKYLQLKKILKFYKLHKTCYTHKIFASFLKLIQHPVGNKLRFYFEKFNKNFPFYGERKLSDSLIYDYEFEKLLNEIALPKELKSLDSSIDKWLFFSFFSIYYTPTFFFHTPYELQLKHNVVSNPQFWSDDIVKLALSIPVHQKLSGKSTKLVLRQAAKLKIDDGYWSLSKIGLQNSYNYLKKSKDGKAFIDQQVKALKKDEDFNMLKEAMPDTTIDAERLIPYYIWKKNML